MEHARTNLLKENLKMQYTFVVGSPMTEILLNIKDKIDCSNILISKNLIKNEYFVWSSHREENIDTYENFLKIIDSLNNLAEIYNKKIVFSIHPRTRKMLNKDKKFELNSNIILSEPLGLIDYYCLQKNSLCVISDSGTVTEESKILGFKAVLLRTSTEHPEGIDAGSIIVGNINWNNLNESIKLALSFDLNNNEIIDYKDNNFSEKVCKIICGYTSIVNKFIWMK
jgi:UDP-N-acetylglucosamine 2-epimerase (non-hydrolysing)